MKNKVEEIRTNLNMPVNKLADLCGVSRQTIHSIETGKYQPTITLALKLAKNLDVKIETLFFLEKGD